MNGGIFGFAFTRRNISCRTLYALKNLDSRYLLWGQKSIDKYSEFLLEHQPDHILGLGIYTGRDQTKIRIETKCSNIFKKQFIEGNSQKELEIKPFLKPGDDRKFSLHS
jgi:pyrrolidone-carboxylate peptidase